MMVSLILGLPEEKFSNHTNNDCEDDHASDVGSEEPRREFPSLSEGAEEVTF